MPHCTGVRHAGEGSCPGDSEFASLRPVRVGAVHFLHHEVDYPDDRFHSARLLQRTFHVRPLQDIRYDSWAPEQLNRGQRNGPPATLASPRRQYDLPMELQRRIPACQIGLKPACGR